MGETCCLCFPLDCGVKTLAVLTILNAVGLGIYSYFDPAYWEAFWPALGATWIMSIVWIAAIMSPGFGKFAAHAWLVLVVIIANGWYTYCIINGSAIDYVCSDDNISEFNDDMAEIEDETGADTGEPLTEQDCRMGGKTGLIIDCSLKWLINLYFAYVIMQWSQKHGDDYHR